MKKRFVSLSLCLVLLLCGCSAWQVKAPAEQEDTLRIVTTIFPPYDFARQIAKDGAQVTMLLKPGTESHSYEPSPMDIITVENCDLFIYNGGESDAWVEKLLSGMDMADVQVIKMLDCVPVLQQTHQHDHDDADMHEQSFDEHVWTSPQNAISIVAAICDAMEKADPTHAQAYRENKDSYIEELTKLDKTLEEIVRQGKRKEMIFADRFPFAYFANRYGLHWHAAFFGCSKEAEPGAKTVANLIDLVKEEQIPCVFTIEFSNQKIANAICAETGAKALQFHSCHNLTPEEMAKGVDYLTLMQQNAENLKEALS